MRCLAAISASCTSRTHSGFALGSAKVLMDSMLCAASKGSPFEEQHIANIVAACGTKEFRQLEGLYFQQQQQEQQQKQQRQQRPQQQKQQQQQQQPRSSDRG
mmetsp:Transcript_79330/g.143155  ORF Transcript_79330/g.143155 Transcript_79330/m.143155 type:complete len:102 (-) Transcript_79330:80-385(-)